MENQRLLEYVTEQMRVGYSESTLREHLLAHGWTVGAIDDVFVRYRRTKTDSLKAVRAAQQKIRHPKWFARRWVKVGVPVVVTACLLVVAFSVVKKNSAQPLVSAKPLTYGEKQAIDVNTVAGAVGQYSIAAGSLPTLIAANQDGSISLCGMDCGSVSPVAVTLTTYKPEGIKFAPYSPGLTVPDQYTMYLVPGAKCANKNTVGDVNTNPRSMVILYAQSDTTNLSQHCIVL